MAATSFLGLTSRYCGVTFPCFVANNPPKPSWLLKRSPGVSLGGVRALTGLARGEGMTQLTRERPPRWHGMSRAGGSACSSPTATGRARSQTAGAADPDPPQLPSPQNLPRGQVPSWAGHLPARVSPKPTDDACVDLDSGPSGHPAGMSPPCPSCWVPGSRRVGLVLTQRGFAPSCSRGVGAGSGGDGRVPQLWGWCEAAPRQRPRVKPSAAGRSRSLQARVPCSPR